MASIHIRFDDDDDSRQVTTRRLPDLPNELTGTAEWKVHRKSRRNSYVLRLQEEDSDRGAPVSYELPVEYINYCWYGLNWNEALKQYFTSNKELLPDNFGGLRRGQPPADEPGLLRPGLEVRTLSGILGHRYPKDGVEGCSTSVPNSDK